jgi:prepilin-type N-terminal cleavage/methylation domain-containing protein
MGRLDRGLQFRGCVERGFSLIEVLVATVLATIATVALAGISLQTLRMNAAARSTTVSTMLASQKIEQIQSLMWAFDASGAPVADTSSDVTATPARPSGGVGLTPSPADALSVNRPGYCDFVDASGESLGGGASAPPGTQFTRRWSVDRLSSSDDSLLIQVSVTAVASGTSGAVSGLNRVHDEPRILTIRSRKGR